MIGEGSAPEGHGYEHRGIHRQRSEVERSLIGQVSRRDRQQRVSARGACAVINYDVVVDVAREGQRIAGSHGRCTFKFRSQKSAGVVGACAARREKRCVGEQLMASRSEVVEQRRDPSVSGAGHGRGATGIVVVPGGPPLEYVSALSDNGRRPGCERRKT